MLATAAMLAGCMAPPPPSVVVYTSVDQHFAEPVLKEFTRQTGIAVKAVYDVEAAKTTGLVNRLIAERPHPRADVFWSGEFVQTLMLAEQGALAPYAPAAAQEIPAQYRDAQAYWTGCAGRARVFIVNTDLLPPERYPASITDLLSDKWEARQVAIALPLFGTALTQAAAHYAAWGPEPARNFYAKLKARGVQVVDGNSVVRDMVAAGQAQWGVTDTDDAAGAVSRGAPVAVVVPDQGEAGAGTLVIPGTVALIAGAPHAAEGRQLLEYLSGRDAETLLIQSGWCHIPLHPQAPIQPLIAGAPVKALALALGQVYEQLAAAKRDLQDIFIK